MHILLYFFYYDKRQLKGIDLAVLIGYTLANRYKPYLIEPADRIRGGHKYLPVPGVGNRKLHFQNGSLDVCTDGMRHSMTLPWFIRANTLLGAVTYRQVLHRATMGSNLRIGRENGRLGKTNSADRIDRGIHYLGSEPGKFLLLICHLPST